MKEDCRPESGPISKPTSSRLDLLNRRVDRFGDGVGRLQLIGVGFSLTFLSHFASWSSVILHLNQLSRFWGAL